MEDRRRLRRIAVLVAVMLAVAFLSWSDDLHRQILGLIATAEPAIRLHPVSGAFLFVGLAAISAILLFFSSVVLVPIGVQLWGGIGCFLLLWLGWFLGGVVTYSLGRGLGRSVIHRLTSPAALEYYERRIPKRRTFWAALLVQLAIPSDVAGYLFGLVAFPAPVYLGALACAELPYAGATVFLGAAFVERQTGVILGFAGGILIVFVVLVFLRRWRRDRGTDSASLGLGK